jgi:chromate transporter
VPAVLIILPLAWAYVTYGHTPQIREALVGVNACVVAIVAAALWRFARTSVKDRFSAMIAALAVAGGFLADPKVSNWLRVHHSVLAPLSDGLARGQGNLVILVMAAMAGAIWYGKPKISPTMLPLGILHADPQFVKMALLFLKVGATLFGSGYVLVSYLQAGIVDEYGWMTKTQLLDAIAVGQVTPGPLLTTATFIGYFLGHARFGGGVGGGIAGGLLATAAIFLPSFILIALLGPLLPAIRKNPTARGALNGMNAAVVAMILVVCVRLGAAALTDVTTILIAIVSLAALLMANVNATWLILLSGGVGILKIWVRH